MDVENENANPNRLAEKPTVDMPDLIAALETGPATPFAEETVPVAGQDVVIGVGPILHETGWTGERRVLFGVTATARGESAIVRSLDLPAAFVAHDTGATEEWGRERALLQRLADTSADVSTDSTDGLVCPLPAAETSGDVLYEQGAPGRNMRDIFKALYIASERYPHGRGWLSDEFISYALHSMRDSATSSLAQLHQVGATGGQFVEYGHAHPGNFIFDWRTARSKLCDYTEARIAEGLDADRVAATERDTRRLAAEWRMALAEDGLDGAAFKAPDAGGLTHEEVMAKLEATLIRVDLSRLGVEITDAEADSVAALIQQTEDRLVDGLPNIRYPQTPVAAE